MSCLCAACCPDRPAGGALNGHPLPPYVEEEPRLQRQLGVKARKLARFDLLPPDVLWEVAEILGWGAANRGDTERNWEHGLVSSEPIGGALRHLAQWMAGEENDSETGKSHLSHAICNLMFARGLQMRGQLIDTRGPQLGPLRTEVVDPAPTG